MEQQDQFSYEPSQPQYTNAPAPTDEIVSFKEWIITLLILIIPFVNIVMMFVWAFSSGTKKSKSNFFKAQLVMVAVMIVLYIVFFATIFSSILGSMNSMYY